MRDTAKRAHKATQGQQWRICRRCYRPFNRSEHGGGCPRCYPALRSLRGSDRKVRGRSIVQRLSAVGESGAKAS